MRCYMSWLALEGMPVSDSGSDPRMLLEQIQQNGYDGVQFEEQIPNEALRLCRDLKLDTAVSIRANVPCEVFSKAERFANDGFVCATLHLGWGMEDNAAAFKLFEAVLEASDKFRFPLFVETHRATLLQDIWRTVQFVREFPDLRFNGDFSHWYTGLELVYGGFEKKIEFLAPVLERIRFLHGRIGNPGCMQVDIGIGDETEHPYVSHFRAFWTASFAGFLNTANPGDFIAFTPELLAPRIYYARVFRDSHGALREESDRWAQSKVLCRIARQCFACTEKSTIAERVSA